MDRAYGSIGLNLKNGSDFKANFLKNTIYQMDDFIERMGH